MSTYETTSTVQEQGRIQVDGVPFAPGTRVEVILHPIEQGVDSPIAPEAGRVERLLTALDKARNVEPIGAFNREELYDRDVLR